MDRIIEEYIDKIKDIDNVNEYDEIIRKLNYSLTDEYPEEFRREIAQKQKYLKIISNSLTLYKNKGLQNMKKYSSI